ncbi:hypothetical protein [Ferrimonas sp. YFM]|uniref:hypothetical protein n=1 Tax=Ferrimonas sp. YFM TaxID=3028878 RepID=UPI00257278A9|nr:hypothetical protein [Ferrimonas sp. YFM]BDY05395.1 phage capsid protein [Ferrimonas sp. YFM]
MTFPLDQTVTRLGQNQNVGSPRALFLKKFAGEVLTQFRPNCLGLQLTRVRNITEGRAATFPLIGRTGAKYHKPGQLVQGDKIPQTEITVTIDDFAISPVFISEIDEAMNHYEVRSQYTKECSDALAELVDRNIFRMVAKVGLVGNRAEADTAGAVTLPDDTFVAPFTLGAGKELDGNSLVDALYKVRTRFRRANMTHEIVAVFAPEQFEALVNVSGKAGNMAWINRDFTDSTQSTEAGSMKIAGITIYESNNLPKSNESAGINDPEPLASESGRTAAYRGDYSRIVGLVFAKDCVATVKLKDIAIVHEDEPLRLGHTIMAKMAVGHNILRHQCACAILRAA